MPVLKTVHKQRVRLSFLLVADVVETLEDVAEDGADDALRRKSYIACCGSYRCFHLRQSAEVRMDLQGRLQEADRQALAALDAKQELEFCPPCATLLLKFNIFLTMATNYARDHINVAVKDRKELSQSLIRY